MRKLFTENWRVYLPSNMEANRPEHTTAICSNRHTQDYLLIEVPNETPLTEMDVHIALCDDLGDCIPLSADQFQNYLRACA